MPTPAYITALREKIGHDLLWLTGVSAVVIFDGRVLLGKRSDDGRWTVPAGILEPGEQPAQAIVREVREETGIEVQVEALVSVVSGPRAEYPNGDQVQFLDLCFACRYVGGEPTVGDDENVEVAWWPLDALPDLEPRQHARLDRTANFNGTPYFAR